MLANGKVIKAMAKEFFTTRMVTDTRDSLLTISDREKVHFTTKMVTNI